MTQASALERAGHALMKLGAWPGRAAGWILLPMVVLVLAAVVGSLFKLGQLATWQADLPLFGNELTLNGLAELQWHALAVIVMLGVSYALAENRHVRVDLLYGGLGPRGQAMIDLIGDLIFLLPFCAIIGWLSIGFVEFSYNTGERSDYGGLSDRYLIKAILPIGFALLALTGIGRILVNLARILTPSTSQKGADRE